MRLRLTAVAATFVAALALPTMAEAALGVANTNANMRIGPSTAYARIATIPAGARFEVFQCSNWCLVLWRGQQGYVAASLISTYGAFAREPGPRYGFGYNPPPRFVRPPPPTWGYYQYPWWDNRYAAWYDGRRWFYNGRWYDRPNGLYFRFSFGG
jgi:hypothetical protein